MRKKLLMLAVFGLSIIGSHLSAAEKPRNWQSGTVVESKVLPDPRDHAIAAADKIYLVKGSIGNDDQALDVGATVRFAVEDKTMYVSAAGKEYKLEVLGVRTATAKPAPSAAAKPSVEPAAPPQDQAALDNDAVVKMIAGGLKEDTVVQVIQSKPGKYTLTPDAMSALKAAGVPQTVISAMSTKMNPKH